MFARSLSRPLVPLAILTCLTSAALAQQPSASVPSPPPVSPALGQPSTVPLAKPPIVHKIQSPNERLEMTVHTSRILTMDQKIPQAQVNNPEILDLTPLSPNQIQVSAKTAGVTQINLWGENQKVFTIDVMVYGDAQELKMLLRAQFPNAALSIVPVANSVLISGYVDKVEHIDRIVRIAEEYYPKVINNMTVGGVQTVLLHVRVMEVSRTKLRQLGFDWAKITGGNTVASGVSGMLQSPTSPSLPTGVVGTGSHGGQ
jgi:pilus assembly protein CpaC